MNVMTNVCNWTWLVNSLDTMNYFVDNANKYKISVNSRKCQDYVYVK